MTEPTDHTATRDESGLALHCSCGNWATLLNSPVEYGPEYRHAEHVRVARLTAELAEARANTSDAHHEGFGAGMESADSDRDDALASARAEGIREGRQAASDAILAHADQHAPKDGNEAQRRLRRHLHIAARVALPAITVEEVAAAFVDALASLTPDTELESTVRTWELPPEPGPEVNRVCDKFGQYFERCDAHNDDGTIEEVWVGQEFLADPVIPDLTLPWEKLMRHHSPLVDATPDTEETGRGA